MTGIDFAIHLIIDFAVIAICIIGIWLFRTPKGARRGNLAAASAMVIAFGLVLWRHSIFDPVFVFSALLIGAGVGYGVARVVTMLQIPTMVALQNGMGGLASLLVALVELVRSTLTLGAMNQLSGIVGLTLGALTFSGSMIAAAKLSAKIRQTPQLLPAHTFLVLLNLSCLLIVGLAAFVAPTGALVYLLIAQIALAGMFGLLFSIRIGGADMPVLISFLNATTGLAAAFCGIVIENQLLIAFGATVAASGSILTHAMCKAMNRSLWRVFVPQAMPLPPEQSQTQPAAASAAMGKADAPDDFKPAPAVTHDPSAAAAGLLKDAGSVVIVPGYGMALAQAQAEVVVLAERLVQMGKTVKYAIHPVAGRMPGHMNVLLAEAGVEYDLLVEMEAVNPEFPATDLALVVGACDVVNPAAIEKEGTPISGMPILMVQDAKHVVCCNLDTKPGYSGVDNSLYNRSNTVMLPGDAKQTLQQLIENLDSDGRQTASSSIPSTESAEGALPLIAAAKILVAAQSVVIIPGYGMALAQAQHKVVELATDLQRHGASVRFAIHPVAGRMPGHMNVVLADADVDYEALVEMDEINPSFARTDAVLIFGACDVVNPAAIHTQGTPISGMPILLAQEAKSVIVCNLDRKPGYSGVDNPLYENPGAILLLGDAKQTAESLIDAVQSLRQ